jgi:hypothetical protein
VHAAGRPLARRHSQRLAMFGRIERAWRGSDRKRKK